MQPITEKSRWDARAAGPATRFGRPTPARRFAGRDLIAIVAGSAAIAGLGVAAWQSGDDREGVSLRRGEAARSGADLGSADGIWDRMTGSASNSPGDLVQPVGPADRSLVAETREEHARQTLAFAKVMQPRLQNGRITGFTLVGDVLPPVFARAGLKPGDVVVTVNGLGLQNTAMIDDLSEELAGSRIAEFIVERDRGLQTLSVKLRDVMPKTLPTKPSDIPRDR